VDGSWWTVADRHLSVASLRAIAFDATSSLVVSAEGEAFLDGSSKVLWWMGHRTEAEAEEICRSNEPYFDCVGGSVSPEVRLTRLHRLKRHRPRAKARVTAIRGLFAGLGIAGLLDRSSSPQGYPTGSALPSRGPNSVPRYICVSACTSVQINVMLVKCKRDSPGFASALPVPSAPKPPFRL
jgi:hypothetical protein